MFKHILFGLAVFCSTANATFETEDVTYNFNDARQISVNTNTTDGQAIIGLAILATIAVPFIVYFLITQPVERNRRRSDQYYNDGYSHRYAR